MLSFNSSARIHAMHGKIQIGRDQLGLDDETYRLTLERTIGKRSRKGCSENQLALIIKELARMGATFKSPSKTRPYRVKTGHSRSDWQDVPQDHPQARIKRHICAVWRELGYDMTSLDTRVKRQFGVEIFAWLNDPDQLHDLARDLNERLKDKKARERAEAMAEDEACQL